MKNTDSENSDTSLPPQPVSFMAALRFWTKLGFVSFGGPAGQIAVMHQELVEQRRWISERRFLRRSTRKRNASGAVYDDPRVAVGAGRVDGVGARAEA